MYTELEPNIRPYGGVKKVSKEGCGSRKCRICACTAGMKCEWGAPLWNTVATKELKFYEGYCHSNPGYLHQRPLSKVS